MKKLFLILIYLTFYTDLHASPQSPDFLIIGKDTFSIYFLPLNQLDTNKLNEFYQNLKADTLNYGIGLNLWRGYQAYWEIEDNKLYLVGLRGYRDSDLIMKATFPDNYNNGRVFANWFSSYLAIGKGKVLKWDGIFSRTNFKEEVFEFSNGILTDRKTVYNYIDLDNGISRLNRKVITNTVFKEIRNLNWKKLSECDCDDKYWITIDESGKISDIELVPVFDTKAENDEYAEELKPCIVKFKDKLKELIFIYLYLQFC